MNTSTQLAERKPGSLAQLNDENARKGPTIAPAVDIHEDAHGITLWADLPGVSRDRLNVHVQDRMLFIEGEALIDTPDGLRLHQQRFVNRGLRGRFR